MAGDPRVTDEMVQAMRQSLIGERWQLTDIEGDADYEMEGAALADALKAALSAASPPAQGGMVVRAAVAMTENGDYSVVGGSNLTDAQAMDDAVGSHGGDVVHRVAILTATIPAPVVPEIAAAVTAEGGE